MPDSDTGRDKDIDFISYEIEKRKSLKAVIATGNSHYGTGGL